ncbi:ATP-binding cassette domain-containing protein [Clostridium kluyveri]|uniref:ATP-binding cassette domain-containing protein n=1 Tax=Clostridium kluyveri TaxID=1534 RepID=UPI0022453A3B|nr:ABC transporter ATP-binding protein [Clostridium kluyveri]UZQ49958.1 ABC transporter ATP-binding protein/permease [Clostridium kluyveri]
MNNSTEKKVITNLIWSINELYRFNHYYIFVMILDCILKGISPTISLLLTNELLNKIQLHKDSFENVIILLGALILFESINELFSNFTQLKLSNYELKFNVFNKVKILDKVSELDSKDFENSSTYDLIDRTQYDANTGILENIKKLFSISSLLISTISYIVIIIKYSVFICMIMIIIPIVRYIFQKKYNLLEYDVIKRNTENNRRSSYISYLITNSECFKEIRMFDLFSFLIKKYKKLKIIYNTDLIRIHNKRTIADSILSIFEILIDFLIIFQIIAQTFAGNLLIGQFILYNSSINSFKTNLISIFSQVSSLYKNSSMIEQVRKFFELPKEVTNNKGINIDNITSIKLENVSYRYKDKYTLKNVNLTLTKGDFVVVMGYNGAGKSTLMKIIMGIYNDYEGYIYINGIDLKLINKDFYRKKVGVMFQNYIKYETSISENVWYGNLKYSSDKNKIDEILSKVNLDIFLKQENQQLGYQFNDGRQISIGQWQKLALARTIIREADLYIFDEPNSSLDLISEDIILNTIVSETKNKIGIMIMHRFNQVISNATKIVVLKDGCIDDIGTHDELLEHKGIYYELYSIQNKI